MAKQPDADGRESIAEESGEEPSRSPEAPSVEDALEDPSPDSPAGSVEEGDPATESPAETGPQRVSTSVDELEDSLQDREEDSDAEEEVAVTREDHITSDLPLPGQHLPHLRPHVRNDGQHQIRVSFTKHFNKALVCSAWRRLPAKQD